jgi:aspartate/methionine/tyrosine aminotransferase
MSRIGTENAFKVVSDIAAAETQGRDVIRLNLGEPDFDSPDHINEVACREIRRGNSHYCEAQGLKSLRQEIARYAGALRGCTFDPECVVVAPGGKPLIAYTLMTYVEPGDEVIYPSPGYPIYESWASLVGANLRPLQLDAKLDFAFGADQLRALISSRTKLIIINSPSNPTGGVLSDQQLADIASMIKQVCPPDVRVLSDEIYDQIVFDGQRHASIAGLPGMAERTIMLSGHSKSFAMTGWRLGYAVLPTVAEAQMFKNLNINFVSCVPPFIQLAGQEALANPLTQSAIAEMVAAFQARRTVVVNALRAIPGVTCVMPVGAFYVFPGIAGALERNGLLERYAALPLALRQRTTPSTIAQMFLLYVHGVATMDRRSFGSVGSADQHFLRLSIATDLDRLERGLERIAKGLADSDGLARFIEQGEHLW